MCVAGSFNDWVPDAKSMHHLGEGRWIKDTALAPGTYEYCLIVDGEWMPDPAAEVTVRNPFGGYNSVLTVTSTPELPREGGADGGRSAAARK